MIVAVAPAAQLATIWDCPQIMKFSQGDKRVWTCTWCPNEADGSRPKPFLGWNATKAISHVCRISGMCVRLCNGEIPPDFALKYKDLYLRQVLSKEQRSEAVDQINASISDTQTGAVSAHFLDCVRMYYERSVAGMEVNVFLSKDDDEE